MPRRARAKRTFGHAEQVRPSGRWRARFTGPDLGRHSAPLTFDTERDAEAWLDAEQRLILADPEGWLPPKARILLAQQRRLAEATFAEYAETWLARRKVEGDGQLHPRMRTSATSSTGVPARVGALPLTKITPEGVLAWYETGTTPEGEPLDSRQTLRGQSYVLLKSIMASAADPAQTGGARIAFNPCAIRGAGTVERSSRTEILTPAELVLVADAMPAGRRLLVLLAAWCSLRSGEVRELRRSDIDVNDGVLRVARAVGKGNVVGPPKSAAGVRDVVIPPSLLNDVRHHLLQHARPGANGLLFPGARGGHLPEAVLWDNFNEARTAAGVTLRFHDLRHTGLTWLAQNGATVGELQAWAGHTTPAVAMRYQHLAQDRKHVLAQRLDAMRGVQSD